MNQRLDTDQPFPAEGRFVLKLHRDCLRHGAPLSGRIEQVATGIRREFGSAAALCVWLEALSLGCTDAVLPVPDAAPSPAR